MATYIRLTEYKDSDSKEQGFFKSENRYEAKQSDFEKIPGSPIAYWVSDRVKEIFAKNNLFEQYADVRAGVLSGNDALFVRNWHEVEKENTGFGLLNKDEMLLKNIKWIPITNGGSFRRWYGNLEDIINLKNDGYDIKNLEGNNYRLRDGSFYFLEGISWTLVSSSDFSVRLSPKSILFGNGSRTAFVIENLQYHISLLNSNVLAYLIKVINPTMNFNNENILSLPIEFPKSNSTKQQIDSLTQECIDISKEEWDSRETSWDFTKNGLLKHLVPKGTLCEKSDSKIETAYNNYCSYWKDKFYKLHANEEELNRLFIDIYELQDELTPDVELKDITILKQESFINDNNELEFKADEIMKQFISYAVGVMFGRYSLDSDGLVVANINQDYPKDTTFEIDDDNVIPVLEDDYFSDDIASRIINFVKTTFGAESLSENINFIEKCLGKTIRTYIVKDFYEDHIKRYKKRPIYWMVSSPKKGFMSLSYMHRYTSDLFARVQNNYLREYITKLEGTKEVLKQTILNESSSTKDKNEADKRIKNIDLKLKELISFDRDNLTSFAQNRVDIDLDDGVKVNYNKFKDVLYVIKGLDKE
ncbi:BREX-1 system adenine-specific DNA-methyltransferase PglX [Aliarcobacter butzleri]|uniref:BREX-1 system adenine-specific DNA-methyltransferase PglX n=1 Tax=Aliarcobacter butzleri TaxID=28197 RepID=UPI0012604E7C|nr:BREX-1 system adenine-specific DNA-methyltransferase PglX [Aliarcobacter butzleri]